KKDDIKKVHHEWITHIRAIFQGYMMRRTIYSKDNKKQPISGLEPWVESSILIPLSEMEMDVQRHLAENLAVEGTFYLSIRQALLHPGFSGITPYKFTAEDELQPYSTHPSTKIDVVLRLLQWHIDHFCRPPLFYDPEEQQFAPMNNDQWELTKPSPGDEVLTDKAIVYLAFPSLNWLIKSALDEQDIPYQEINGLLGTAQRAAALTEFRTSKSVHVLLLSGVGLCGLNMAFANIVIIVDNLWSAQEDQQLIGRVWRYSQMKRVIVYRVIAQETSDVFLNNIGFQKGNLHSEF
ncbi:P-loop containing nucleoside triphosphate hydrolase protein, partial [Lenzites betulinus]